MVALFALALAVAVVINVLYGNWGWVVACGCMLCGTLVCVYHWPPIPCEIGAVLFLGGGILCLIQRLRDLRRERPEKEETEILEAYGSNVADDDSEWPRGAKRPPRVP